MCGFLKDNERKDSWSLGLQGRGSSFLELVPLFVGFPKKETESKTRHFDFRGGGGRGVPNLKKMFDPAKTTPVLGTWEALRREGIRFLF